MFARTETRGMTEELQRGLMIFTLEENANEHTAGAVRHEIGSESVNIQSTASDFGAIPVDGRDNLKLLRDALIKICEEESIE